MKNRFIYCIPVLVLLFVSNSCKMMDSANKNYDYFEYTKAIPKYKKVLEKDSTNMEAWAKLGDCYRLNNQTMDAEQCYKKAVQDPKVKNIYKLYYAQMMVNNVNYAGVHEWIEDYLKEEPNDSRAAMLDSGLTHMDEFEVDKEKFRVRKLNINSKDADYGPSIYKDGIVFTSSRNDENRNNKSDSWTGRRYFSVFYSKGSNTQFEEPVIFLNGIQTKYNNSSVCFNPNGTEMAMTRNNVENEKVVIDQDSSVKLKLYFSTLKDSLWTDAMPFKYNNDLYSCAHAAYSPDGKKLYFSSDMPGSIGGMDIWVCNRTTKGWSKPINLGKTVNTIGNEVFPTVSKNGNIYYSSNGLEGMGGLDIYMTTENSGTYSKAKNVGAPLNSSDDDFGLIWDTENKMGYMSSNRSHQGYNDDIYCVSRNVSLVGLVCDKNNNLPLDRSKVRIFENDTLVATFNLGKAATFDRGLIQNKNYKIITEHKHYKADTLTILASELNPPNDTIIVRVLLNRGPIAITLEGTVNSQATLHPVENAQILLINLTTNDTIETFADKDGHYIFTELDTISHYRLYADGKLSIPTIIDTLFTGVKESKTLQMDIDLYNLAETNVIRNIYYDLNKYNIRKDAARELDKLARVMIRYPNIDIELGSHTDSRSSYSYNMALSQKRAQSAVDYLVKKGVASHRMTARGYGESQLVNKCVSEGDVKVFCTEQDHQMNRRTEITVHTKSVVDVE